MIIKEKGGEEARGRYFRPGNKKPILCESAVPCMSFRAAETARNLAVEENASAKD
jgi:hypothetical protein